MNDYTITLPRTPAVVLRAKGFAVVHGALVFYDAASKDFFALAPGNWVSCCLAGKEPLPEYQGEVEYVRPGGFCHTPKEKQ